MKKVCIILSLILVVGLISVSALSKEELRDEAKKYEQTIEKDKTGEIEWYPFSMGDGDYAPDAELGEEFQYGVSSEPENFTYFYDEEKGYLIQYYDLNKKGVVIWEGEVPISYEEFR